MSKPCKLVSEKNLSGPGGVYDVTLGPATPERRAQRDFSKDGIAAPKQDSFDDYNEKIERWQNSEFGRL